jgi:hypothetical protein
MVAAEAISAGCGIGTPPIANRSSAPGASHRGVASGRTCRAGGRDQGINRQNDRRDCGNNLGPFSPRSFVQVKARLTYPTPLIPDFRHLGELEGAKLELSELTNRFGRRSRLRHQEPKDEHGDETRRCNAQKYNGASKARSYETE